MNAIINSQLLNRRVDDRRAANDDRTPVHRPYRERDFGIGYGKSSGYASDRRYTTRTFTPLYRCA